MDRRGAPGAPAPGWVTVPEYADDWTVRAHAATGYAAGPPSHMSALAVHRVVDVEVTRLNVTVPENRRVRTSRWLQVHRSLNPVDVVQARGLPATTIARSLIDTWGDAHRARALRGFNDVARGALLRATRERRVTLGVLHVLTIPGLPRCHQQYRVILPDGPALLDAAWPEVKLAVELDGAAFHGSREARERDLRRDAALAAKPCS